MIKLGYQIPNFTYPDTGASDLFAAVVAQAQAAEANGFDTVLVMDHFYQLPGLGPPEHEMLECYSTLAALAQATERVQLSALVTGNTYRNPAMLAKTVTTLDVISGGRAVLGVGAGWFELEHDGYGYEFGTFSDRFDKLEEALQIIKPMFAGERPTFTGEHYRVQDALNEPRVRDDLPIMLGGGGEKKTFRMAAQYADELNIIAGMDEIPRKLEALAARCEEQGRDLATLPTSFLMSVILAPTMEGAVAARNEYLAARGVDWATMEPLMGQRLVFGDPDTVAARLADDVIGAGIGGLTINMPANGHDPEIVALAGQTLAPVVGVS
ncbi:MAG: LLM class F420-dependent oxidoreductase [Actinomycetota bacterium]